MDMLGWFVLGLASGGLMVLAGPNLARLGRRQACRNLSSALIGETVALLDAVESHKLVARLEALGRGEQEQLGRLPPLPMVVFGANADKLDRLPAPLPRKIAYFYTRLATLWGRLEALGAMRASEHGLTAQEAAALARELNTVLDLADDVLRHLRQGLVRHRLRNPFRRELISTLPAYRKFARRTLMHPFAKRPYVPPGH